MFFLGLLASASTKCPTGSGVSNISLPQRRGTYTGCTGHGAFSGSSDHRVCRAGESASAGATGVGTTTLGEGDVGNAGAGGAFYGGAGREFRNEHKSCLDIGIARTLLRASIWSFFTTPSSVLVSWLYSNKGKKGSVNVKYHF